LSQFADENSETMRDQEEMVDASSPTSAADPTQSSQADRKALAADTSSSSTGTTSTDPILTKKKKKTNRKKTKKPTVMLSFGEDGEEEEAALTLPRTKKITFSALAQDASSSSSSSTAAADETDEQWALSSSTLKQHQQQQKKSKKKKSKKSVRGIAVHSGGAKSAGSARKVRTAPTAPAAVWQQEEERSARTTNTQVSQEGAYSAERLRAMREEARRYQAPPTAAESSADPYALAAPSDSGKDGRQLLQSMDTSDDPAEESAFVHASMQLRQREQREQHEQWTGRSEAMVEVETEDDDVLSIPNQLQIRRAREKRERMRRIAVGDYVPLVDREVIADGETAQSGLVRESVEDEEPSVYEEQEDEQHRNGRIQFGDPAQQEAERRRRMRELVVTEEEEHAGEGALEEDEEVLRWEQEQIRKGRGSLRPSAGERQQAGVGVRVGGDPLLLDDEAGARVRHAAQLASAGGRTAPTLALDQTRRQMHAAVKALRDRVHSRSAALQRARAGVAEARAQADRLLGERDHLDRDYHRLQETRDYVHSLLACLEEKAPQVDQLEEEVEALLSRRCAELREAARTQLADRVAELRNQLCGRDLFSPLGRHSPTRQQQADQAAEEGVDEFGRDRGLQKRVAWQRRRKRRLAVLGAAADDIASVAAVPATDNALSALSSASPSALSPASLAVVGQDGWNSDTDADRVAARRAALGVNPDRWREERDLLLERAHTLMSDALPEFSTVAGVKRHFERWKRDCPAQYAQAYCSLLLPRILEPLVRLECLEWEPLHCSPLQPFADMQWFRLLFDYAADLEPEQESEREQDDLDQVLVPKLVELVCVPRVLHAVREQWDCFSRSEGAHLLELCEELAVFFGDQGKPIKRVRDAVLDRLEEAVLHADVPLFATADNTGSQPQQSASPLSSSQAAGERRALAAAADQLSHQHAVRLLKLADSLHRWEQRLSSPRRVSDLFGHVVAQLLPYVRLLLERRQSGDQLRVARGEVNLLQVLRLLLERVPAPPGSGAAGRYADAVQQLFALVRRLADQSSDQSAQSVFHTQVIQLRLLLPN